MTRKIVLYCDGASRGNPGQAAIGVFLTDPHGKEIESIAEMIGEATNNEAEYRALLWGLEQAAMLGADQIEIRTDSELLAMQLSGDYRVRVENLKTLHAQVQRSLKRFAHVSIHRIPREHNRRADALANQALNRANRSGGR